MPCFACNLFKLRIVFQGLPLTHTQLQLNGGMVKAAGCAGA